MTDHRYGAADAEFPMAPRPSLTVAAIVRRLETQRREDLGRAVRRVRAQGGEFRMGRGWPGGGLSMELALQWAVESDLAADLLWVRRSVAGLVRAEFQNIQKARAS